ncbi:MAG: 3-hydroxyacyl-CoA dehydrogenase [Alphaproteobacteria bacterium]|nr:3-hydroxyacyl-CoA dehydrogenase [Alphaproteobacteria bacterium]
MQPKLPKTRHWRFHLDFEKIGWLVIDTPGASVNVLSTEAITELESLVVRFEDLIAGDELVGIVVMSGKKSGFIAGADVTEFDAMSDPAILPGALRRTHAVFERIEKLKAPVAACIDGFCLGGGLELALACHYRIAVASDKTRLGFPEVKLGLFPGFGGTGRSIKAAGPIAAMTAMLTGRAYVARAAKAMGLVDKLVPHRDNLRWEGRKAVLSRRRSKGAGFFARLPAMGPMRRISAQKMTARTAAKANRKHYPAPFALIDLFERRGDRPEAMIRGEIEPFVNLMGSDTAVNLRRLFFLSEGLKKQRARGADAPLIRRVHVVGAGVMGGDIAAWCASRGLDVTLQDLDEARIQPALIRAKKLFQKRLKKPVAVASAISRLRMDVAGAGIGRADVIIEAIVENLEIKRTLFADLEQQAGAHAILATNTSSIPLEKIATALKKPGRLIGLHFFNPVAQLPLVEVVRGEKNDDRAVAAGCSFALGIGKSPVVVKSAPGFLVNRVLMPYMIAAVARVENGESAELLDAGAVAFGMPMGPIELMDTVGLDIAKNVAEELGHPVPKESRLARLVAAGKLGRKTGEGFYTWQAGKVRKDAAPAFADLEGLGRDLVKPLVDEAELCVAEGIVASRDLADIGIILGTGFAPFLGGPLKARADGKA